MTIWKENILAKNLLSETSQWWTLIRICQCIIDHNFHLDMIANLLYIKLFSSTKRVLTEIILTH